eukprot:Colp12_sorted_trinity150504_noHs@12895
MDAKKWLWVASGRKKDRIKVDEGDLVVDLRAAAFTKLGLHGVAADYVLKKDGAILDEGASLDPLFGDNSSAKPIILEALPVEISQADISTQGPTIEQKIDKLVEDVQAVRKWTADKKKIEPKAMSEVGVSEAYSYLAALSLHMVDEDIEDNVPPFKYKEFLCSGDETADMPGATQHLVEQLKLAGAPMGVRNGYKVVDVHTVLMYPNLPITNKSGEIIAELSGKHDIVIVPFKSRPSYDSVIRVAFEIKLPGECKKSEGQAISEFLASYFTSDHPILFVLTDLQAEWFCYRISNGLVKVLEGDGSCAIPHIARFLQQSDPRPEFVVDDPRFAESFLMKDMLQGPVRPQRRAYQLQDQLHSILPLIDSPLERHAAARDLCSSFFLSYIS